MWALFPVLPPFSLLCFEGKILYFEMDYFLVAVAAALETVSSQFNPALEAGIRVSEICLYASL